MWSDPDLCYCSANCCAVAHSACPELARCQRDASRQRPQMMCSKWMRSGVLCRRKSKNGGYGQPCVAGRGRLWHSSSVTASLATCLRFWNMLQEGYKHCHTFSDFWHIYQHVFPAETHRCVGKKTGETAHMERWNNTLRQRVGRYVRETLSFSKSDEYHHLVTRWFIVQYNLGLSLAI